MNGWRCESCRREVPTRVVERRETFPVRSEEIEIESNVRVCEICGSDIYDRELDSANLETAYDLFSRTADRTRSRRTVKKAGGPLL